MIKCCICNKELKKGENENEQHKWIGLYNMSGLIRAICTDCEKKPENKNWVAFRRIF